MCQSGRQISGAKTTHRRNTTPCTHLFCLSHLLLCIGGYPLPGSAPVAQWHIFFWIVQLHHRNITDCTERSLLVVPEPPVGGPGTVVQIDECYLSGRCKKHVWRLLGGNRMPTTHQNLADESMVLGFFRTAVKRTNGTIKVQTFHVRRRDEASCSTACPSQNGNIERWMEKRTETYPAGQITIYLTFTRSVNHKQNFVNPTNGVNKQMTEC